MYFTRLNSKAGRLPPGKESPWPTEMLGARRRGWPSLDMRKKAMSHFANKGFVHVKSVTSKRTVTLGTNIEQVRFASGMVVLYRLGFAGMASNNQVALTDADYAYCRNHNVDVENWTDTYENFGN